MESQKETFPLLEAYTFAEQHGLSKEAAEIREMEIELFVILGAQWRTTSNLVVPTIEID